MEKPDKVILLRTTGTALSFGATVTAERSETAEGRELSAGEAAAKRSLERCADGTSGGDGDVGFCGAPE